jgi:uncharacterized lipoprotein YddW (UPF0748 family)
MTVLRRLLLAGLALFLLASCQPFGNTSPGVMLRGVWVQAKAVTTEDDANAVLEKAEQAGFEQIFVGVFETGTTIYPSAVAEQNEDVFYGFDPLAYLVEQAHQRGIQVHAWFEVGRVANHRGKSAVIEAHPDWAMVGPEGQTVPWLNFTHPEARAFVREMVMEAVGRGVDGVHFDYLRYPDHYWGFDEYSLSAFRSEHDFDLNELRYPDLPAYGLFEGNALLHPDSAQVLARFSNGFPAILLNEYGAGSTLILNWQAAERNIALGSSLLQRAIETFLDEGRQIAILRSETTIARYGDDAFSATVEWVRSLGWDAVEVSAPEMAEMEAGSVLILPSVYLFTESEAAGLAAFVSNGGHAIFIDGPTPSIGLEDLQEVTGMRPLRKHFEQPLQITASTEHPLLPMSGRSETLRTAKARHQQWYAFREEGINSLLEEVYKEVKAEHPEVIISVTITSDQEQAKMVSLQAWQTWLEEGYIDVLIPRAYEDTPEEVRRTLQEWARVTRRYDRLTYGLIAYTDEDGEVIPKDPEYLLAEIDAVADTRSNGFLVFDLDRLSPAQLDALANLEW